ncbi:hypothetical protein ACET3Z_030165 [Daucus carota]
MPIFTAALGSAASLYFHSHDNINTTSTLLHTLSSPPSCFCRNSVSVKRINASVNQSSTVADSPAPAPPPPRGSADWKAAKTHIEKGLIYQGRIENFNGGGLLVRFQSLLGFLPFPQLSPSHSCKEPNKSIQEIAKALTGSLISVKVIQADETNKKLILSEKEAAWVKYSRKVSVGDVFDARVGSIEDYGAFLHLRFPDGLYHLTGLVHVSEVSWDLVQDVRDILHEGDEVRAKVIKIDSSKSRITLSIKQLEEDPLLETLDKVIPKDGSAGSDSSGDDESYDIEPLQGLEAIVEELLQEDGISDVRITRQGFEKRVVSQDLQLWLSNAPSTGEQFTLLARAGRQVQEIQLTTVLDQEGAEKISGSDFLSNLRGSHKGDTVASISMLKKYLQDIGYIKFDPNNANISSNIFDDLLESALKTYQSYYGLNVSGLLDDNTVSLLSQPRCGVPDFPKERLDYSFFPGKHKWGTYNLTFAFAPGTREDAINPVANALEDWASVSPFRFSLNNIFDDANFKISFQQFYGPYQPLALGFEPTAGKLHYNVDRKWVNGKVPGKPKWWTYNLTFAFASGTRFYTLAPVAKALEDWGSVSPFRFSLKGFDEANFKISFQPFYGPHQPLAYSLEPTAGKLHFNVHERWVNGKVPGGYDIESVALHEIGHLLGLEHSKDFHSIMYAYFWPNTVKITLQPDDIQGLKVLYGVEKASASDFLSNLRGSHKGDTVEGISVLKKYLQDIGYIKSDPSNTNISTNIFDDLLESALETYQSYYGLNVTGFLDDNTVSLLSQPRCGVPDFPEERTDYSFFPGKPKWWTYNLTFGFASGTRFDALAPVAKALEDWGSVSPFRFSLKGLDEANFKINFQPFYGPHQPLAVGFEPTNGTFHFNVHEKWVNGKVPGGFDMESVALHEIGHLLGLEHSKEFHAIMYAYFWPNTVKLTLQPDDIQGLKVLYGF